MEIRLRIEILIFGRKMRVLIINEVCGTGSTGRICSDLAFELNKQGHEVKIAYGRHGYVPENCKKYAIRIGTIVDVLFHVLLARLFDKAGFGSMRATRCFIQWVKEYNPDVIHLHNLHGYYINVEQLFHYLKESNKKILWTLHDCWAFTGHSAACDAIECRKWIEGCENCPQKNIYPKSWVDCSRKNWKRKKALFSGVKNMEIITPSEWLLEEVKKSFLGNYNTSVIHNGIDTDIFKKTNNNYRKKLNLNDHDVVILAVATVWNDFKGYKDYIKLSLLLDKQFKIVLVGGMTRAQEKQLPDRIIHIKKTYDIYEMVQLYNIADLYLNLTYCDTYPTVDLEAIACRVPLVTYRVGGSAEIAERFGGVSVARGNVQKIVQLLNKKSPFQGYTGDLSELEKKHSIKKYIKKYMEVTHETGI